MKSREATEREQALIDQCNEILKEVELTVSELTDKVGGAVLPSKGF